MTRETVRLLGLLARLISFKSITPNSAGCIEYIAGLLASHNFRVIIQESHRIPKTTNLYAFCPLSVITSYQQKLGYIDWRDWHEQEEGGRDFEDTKWWEFKSSSNMESGDLSELNPSYFNLCFAGHVDVVPAGDAALWPADPFELYQEDGILYGRGMVDMKGAIAAAICAVFRVLDLLRDGSLDDAHGLRDLMISFLFTSDEEGTGEYGLRKMLSLISHLGYTIDLAVLGEPASKNDIGDLVKIGRRGSANFDLIIYGMQGHVAYPELCVNPNAILVKFLNALVVSKLDEGCELFQPSNLEITSIDCNNHLTNVIPSSARVRFNIRFNTLHTHQSLKSYIEDELLRLAPGIRYDLTCSSNHFAFVQDMGLELMQKILAIVQKKTRASFSTSGGVSDACYISAYCPVVEIGLKHGSAHKPAECVSLKDLEELVEIYSNIILQIH
ncbi:Succinyl-diaminopimelate desuccinylase [Rickettsiales endosymbiont of Paramecium tredecaurelia]|nr:Succinyl-diaminopimelate desuccinylase [Candidatus Sarmatiella mevalonica]